jgi:hypothetical protein
MPSSALEISIPPLHGATYDSIVSPSSSLPPPTNSTSATSIPDSKALETVMGRIQNLIDQIESRDDAASKALRKIIEKRNERVGEEREEGLREREREREREEEVERLRKANKRRKVEAGNVEGKHAHTTGKHGVAVQDGTNHGMWKISSLLPRRPDVISKLCDGSRGC